MKDMNQYWRQLTADEIAAGGHREFVGGMWDEIGALQYEYLKSEGLRPNHRLLDVGCGALRGGRLFVGYLDPGNYHGLDINESLLEAGRCELMSAGLADRGAHLLASDSFDASAFGVAFDFALAVSLFTHLYLNHIARCLAEVRRVLTPEGRFYATFFRAAHPAYLSDLTHDPGGVTTHFDSDPFHYALDDLSAIAANVGLKTLDIGEWRHPRAQQMLCFTVA